MQLSIIIVSWNVKDYLQQCLQSIYQYTHDISFEVIVVDNASSDGSADMVAQQFPQVHLICNAANRGFGYANNQGYKIATGEYVLFLNDDTAIHDNIFPTLIQRFKDYHDSREKIGMLGCKLLNPDGTQQDSVRKFPTVLGQTAILLKLHHSFPRLIASYMQTDFNYEHEQRVDQIMGAFMLAPRAVLEQVGIFDEQFFNWFEEVDLQKRITQAGYDILYTPSVSCTHIKGPSFAQLRKPMAQKIFNASMRYYFRKHHSMLAYLWLCAIQPISVLLSYVVQIIS